jgi:hypothetical protein
MLSEVALEADDPDAVVGGVQALESREGPVGGAVVDEDQLEGRVERLERRDRPCVQLLERGRLVEDGDDDREVGLGARALARRGRRQLLSLGHMQGSSLTHEACSPAGPGVS